MRRQAHKAHKDAGGAATSAQLAWSLTSIRTVDIGGTNSEHKAERATRVPIEIEYKLRHN